MSEELKLSDCPFCGAAMRIPMESSCAHSGAGDLYVNCDCGAMGAGGKTLDEAVAAWNRRATSPSPASDAELPQASAEEVETARLAAAHYGRPESDIPALIAFERHRVEQSRVPGMPGLTGAVSLFVAGFRAASTRTASDTRTAAGSVECDSALHAEPAGQHDAIAAARARLEAKWDADGDCGSCGWHAALYEHNVEDWEIEHALEKNGGVLEMSCVSKDGDDRSSHRGVKINIAPPREESAPAGAACQGGNTKEAALQELVDIAQANNMGYGPPAVDVEAERPRFDAWFEKQPLPYVLARMDPKQAAFNAWLAARTQADAGKDAATLRAELLRLRGWFESQAKVISKGGGSSWDMAQCREQIESIDATTKPENT